MNPFVIGVTQHDVAHQPFDLITDHDIAPRS
jgi:hypothetical protein